MKSHQCWVKLPPLTSFCINISSDVVGNSCLPVTKKLSSLLLFPFCVYFAQGAFYFTLSHINIYPIMNTRMDTKRVQKNDCLIMATVYKRDVGIGYSYVGRPRPRRDGTRKAIIGFSKRSAKRLRHIIRNSEDDWKAFVTLTYPTEFTCNGRETKGHLNTFLQFLRRRKLKNVWILEFQERGAPNYHLFVNGFIPKDDLAKALSTVA